MIYWLIFIAIMVAVAIALLIGLVSMARESLALLKNIEPGTMVIPDSSEEVTR